MVMRVRDLRICVYCYVKARGGEEGVGFENKHTGEIIR